MRLLMTCAAFAASALCASAGACGETQSNDRPDVRLIPDVNFDIEVHLPADPFGGGERIAKATDPTSDACTRATTLIDTLQTRSATLEGRNAGFATEATNAIKEWVAEFGAYDPLVFGEVQRVHDAILEDDEVTDGELELEIQALSMHATFGGIDPEARARLVTALSGLESKFGSGPIGKAARQAEVEFIASVAEFMASLESCAPSQPQ